jgi:hypothetical protein
MPVLRTWGKRASMRELVWSKIAMDIGSPPKSKWEIC